MASRQLCCGGASSTNRSRRRSPRRSAARPRSSTSTATSTWIFTHNLAGVGTLVVYDDWMDYNCAPRVNQSVADIANGPLRMRWVGGKQTKEGLWMNHAIRDASNKGRFGSYFSAGEPKAHREIARKHRVDFRCVAGSCGQIKHHGGGERFCDISSPFGAVFVVAGIGGSIGDDGTDSFNAGVENNDPDSLRVWRQQNNGCHFVMSNKFTLDDRAPVRERRR